LFKPPYGWEELPPDIRRTNIYLKRRYHGLAWDYGDLAYSKVRATLRQHMHGIVFVKGADKFGGSANCQAETSTSWTFISLDARHYSGCGNLHVYQLKPLSSNWRNC